MWKLYKTKFQSVRENFLEWNTATPIHLGIVCYLWLLLHDHSRAEL